MQILHMNCTQKRPAYLAGRFLFFVHFQQRPHPCGVLHHRLMFPLTYGLHCLRSVSGLGLMVVDKSDDLGMHYIGVHQLLIGKLRIHISERAIVVPVFRCLFNKIITQK